MLREQASHDNLSLFLRTGVLTIATVKFVGHPLRERPFVGFDGRELVRMLGQVIRERVSEFGGEGFASLESFCCQPKGGGLKTGIVGRHPYKPSPLELPRHSTQSAPTEASSSRRTMPSTADLDGISLRYHV